MLLSYLSWHRLKIILLLYIIQVGMDNSCFKSQTLLLTRKTKNLHGCSNLKTLTPLSKVLHPTSQLTGVLCASDLWTIHVDLAPEVSTFSPKSYNLANHVSDFPCVQNMGAVNLCCVSPWGKQQYCVVGHWCVTPYKATIVLLPRLVRSVIF